MGHLGHILCEKLLKSNHFGPASFGQDPPDHAAEDHPETKAGVYGGLSSCPWSRSREYALSSVVDFCYWIELIVAVFSLILLLWVSSLQLLLSIVDHSQTMMMMIVKLWCFMLWLLED